MMRRLLLAGCALLALGSATAANATERGMAAGGLAGVVGGAIVAGPIGAVVGGVGGGLLGNHYTDHPHHFFMRHHEAAHD